MRQLIFSTILFAGFLISCDADDNSNVETPSVVLNTFQSKFPNAQDIEWEKIQDNFEVEFEVDQTEYTALLSPDGKLIKHKNDISLSELPEAVRLYLEEGYETKNIDDIEVLNIEESTYYQVEIERDLSTEKIVLDINGEIIGDIEYMD